MMYDSKLIVARMFLGMCGVRLVQLYQFMKYEKYFEILVLKLNLILVYSYINVTQMFV